MHCRTKTTILLHSHTHDSTLKPPDIIGAKRHMFTVKAKLADESAIDTPLQRVIEVTLCKDLITGT